MIRAVLAMWLLMALVRAIPNGDKFVRTRSLYFDKGVIVQLMEWKWKDIAKECETFLSRKGYAAVQISPASENRIVAGRPWWERYQVASYQLTSRSGTHKELVDMIRRCNNVGVWIFADVVINHMTGSVAECEGAGGSHCDPDTFSYPVVPYDKEHFHFPQCNIRNWHNATEVRVCNLYNLLDLNTSHEHVQKKIAEYMNHLIHIGVAGFRIDAAKHISPEDLSGIYSHLKNLNPDHGFPLGTSPYIYHDVIDVEGYPIQAKDYLKLGSATDFKFARELGIAFTGKNDLKWFHSFGEGWGLLPDDQGVVFVDDHYTERLNNDKEMLTFKSSAPYKMAITFMLAFGYGTPKIMSSFNFMKYDDPPPMDMNTEALLSPEPDEKNICKNRFICQHRWRQIYNMVTFYNVVDGTNVHSWWSNGKNQISFCRGNKGFIAFNLEKVPLKQRLQTCQEEGVYCDVISGSKMPDGSCTGKKVTVGPNGFADILIPAYNIDNKWDDAIVAIHTQFKDIPVQQKQQIKTFVKNCLPVKYDIYTS